VAHPPDDADRGGAFIPPPGHPDHDRLMADALLDPKGVAAVARRVAANKVGQYARTSIHSSKALLGGGLGRCGRCGALLRVKGSHYLGKKGEKYHLYYACTRHDKAPSRCPGIFVAAKHVDRAAWEYVLSALTTISWDPDEPDSELRTLERIDAARAAVPKPSGPSLEHIRGARDQFLQDAETLTLEILRAKSQLARDTLQRQIDKLEPQIEKATSQIAELERQATLQSERARVLGDFLMKYRRYFDYLELLDAGNESDIPIMAGVLRAVGAVVSVPPSFRYEPIRSGEGWIDLGGGPDLDIELTLTAGSGFPWADNEEMVRMLDTRRRQKIESEAARKADVYSLSAGRPSLR
jgi:hypothetical protein